VITLPLKLWTWYLMELKKMFLNFSNTINNLCKFYCDKEWFTFCLSFENNIFLELSKLFLFKFSISWYYCKYHICRDRRVLWLFDLQKPTQSMPITTKVVSSNSTYFKVYSMQHYVIKFVSHLRLVGVFLLVLLFPPAIKQPPWYLYNIVESGVKHHKPCKWHMQALFQWSVHTLLLRLWTWYICN
jgi:hypothetical protein